MKNKKWLTYTVGTLLTLIVLAVVAGASFRIGMMQNASFTRPAFAQHLNGERQQMQGNFQNNGDPQAQGNSQNNDGNQSMQQGGFGPQGMQGFQNRGFDNRNNSRDNGRRGGMSFFPIIFGLIHLALLGLVIWVVYKLVQKSGWRLTRVTASAAPAADKTPSADVEEKKESE